MLHLTFFKSHWKKQKYLFQSWSSPLVHDRVLIDLRLIYDWTMINPWNVQAESSLKELTSQKIKLEYDLHVKQTSLGIDQGKCIQTRTKYPIKLKEWNHMYKISIRAPSTHLSRRTYSKIILSESNLIYVKG